MSWLLLAGGVILFIELAKCLPLVVIGKYLGTVVSRVSRVIRSTKISDHWKEKVLLKYAQLLFLQSLKLSLVCLVCLLPVLLIAVVAEFNNIPVLVDWMEWPAIAGGTLFAIVYTWLRSKVVGIWLHSR